MNLNKTLKNIKGDDIKMAFPRNDEEGKMDETVKNILLNSLGGFPIRIKKEIFLVNKLASKIMDADEKTEFTEAERNFLKEVLWEATYQKDEKKNNEVRGVYLPFVIAQVATEIGIDSLE